MVSRDKEQLIIKLLKEGKDWDYIRKVAHCSPNTIQNVKEKKELKRVQKIKSNRSEALKMYDKNYTALRVAIKLDISADEAENYRLDFWRLEHMDRFEKLYKSIKEWLPYIIGKFDEMKRRNISIDRLDEGLKLVDKIPTLQVEYQDLLIKKKSLLNEYKEGQEEYRQLQEKLDQLRAEHLKMSPKNISVRRRRVKKHEIENTSS